MTEADSILLDRALGILQRMALENTGLAALFWRWYFPDEPLRNDAANLLRESKIECPRPKGTRLVGDP